MNKMVNGKLFQKEALERKKVEYIKQIVLQYFDVSQINQKLTRAGAVNVINEYLQRTKLNNNYIIL